MFLTPSIVAQKTTPPKADSTSVHPQIKDAVSKPAPDSEKVITSLSETQPAPPEPKKRTNRRMSITNSDKDVEPLFDINASSLKENEDEKGIQHVKLTEKDTNVAQDVMQVERDKENDNGVNKKDAKSVKASTEAAEPTGYLDTDKEVFMEGKQPEVNSKEVVDLEPEISQPDRRLDKTLVKLKQVGKDYETKKSLKLKEKTNEVNQQMKQLATIDTDSQDKKHLAKTQEKVNGKEKTDQNYQNSQSFKRISKLEKMEEVPLIPPARMKGKVTYGVKCNSKDTEDILLQVIKAEENHKQTEMARDEATLKLTTSVNQLEKQAVKTQETLIEKVCEFALPKPPTRTKGKAKKEMEKQLSRDTETDQDEQEPRNVTGSVGDKTIKQVIKTKETEDKPRLEENQSFVTDNKDLTEVKQPIKQPVKPIRKEQESVQQVKSSVEPMRREEEQQTSKKAEDVPLLYISEDETFSEALTDLPPKHVHPIVADDEGHPGELPLQEVQPPEADDEGQMQEAAVKIQAAFKGFKTRRDMKPTFKEVFKNQDADLHGTLTLKCIVEGKPSTVHWLKNGQHIANDLRYRVETSDNGECILIVKNLTNSDSGVYTCEVANKFGVTSYNGNITVVKTAQPANAPQKPVHPPLAAITPLQLAPIQLEAKAETQSQDQLQSQAQVAASGRDAGNYVESVSVSLWEAFNLTEQDTQRSLQERRRSSLVAVSSSE